jgi:hypothetical protein
MTDRSPDEALGVALLDLASRLRMPAQSIWPEVEARITATPALRGRRRSRLLVAALVLAAVLIAVAAIAPARQAVADFLGIGSTEVRVVEHGAEGAPPKRLAPVDDVDPLRAQLRAAGLVLPDPSLVGEPIAAQVRLGSETLLGFADVVLAQRHEGGVPVLKRVSGRSRVEAAQVGDTAALWIEGRHTRQVGNRVVRSESALVWVAYGLELRLEGDLPRERMLAIARSVRTVEPG